MTPDVDKWLLVGLIVFGSIPYLYLIAVVIAFAWHQVKRRYQRTLLQELQTEGE